MKGKSKIKKNRKGFTLIELIVVMIIIGILVLLAAPRFLNYVKKARYTNIINDVKVVETVSLPQMVRGKREFPVGTGNVGNPRELLDGIDDQVAYMKDGYILNYDKVGKDFKPEVGKISKITRADINDNNKFYMLDKADFVKKETSTTLKGQFYINIDGDVIYVDDPSIDRETPGDFDEEEGKRASQMYEITTKDMEKGTAKITGINLKDEDGNEISKEDWADKYLDKDLRIDYRLPPIPKYDEDANRITELGRGAFGHINVRDKVNLVGDFNAPYIEIIHGQFATSIEFDGKFNAPNVKKVGSNAFLYSKFIGVFNAPNLISVEDAGFRMSHFRENFYAPKIERIGQGAFKNSMFEEFTPADDEMIDGIENGRGWTK